MPPRIPQVFLHWQTTSLYQSQCNTRFLPSIAFQSMTNVSLRNENSLQRRLYSGKSQPNKDQQIVVNIGEKSQGSAPNRQQLQEEALRAGLTMLFPNTFIKPTGKNLPGLFTKLRWKLEYIHYKTKFQAGLAKTYLRLFRKLKFAKRKTIKPLAEDLYKQMYTSFARGDMHALGQICGPDLRETFRGRVERRPLGITYEWKFYGFTKRSKIVSDLVTLIRDNIYMRQIIVRIDSRQGFVKAMSKEPGIQSLKRTTMTKEDEKTKRKKVKTREYLVLHQNSFPGNDPDRWLIWGTTEETDEKTWNKRLGLLEYLNG